MASHSFTFVMKAKASATQRTALPRAQPQFVAGNESQQSRVFLGAWPEIGDHSRLGRPQFRAKPWFSGASIRGCGSAGSIHLPSQVLVGE
jgi:hypothetical protein